MLEEFQNIDLLQLSIYTVLTNLAVLLALITTVVIMVIGNNLARAFGLVGAMSIIRFRTAVRDVQDIVYIFFALAVGMASGVGLHAIAIAATLFICLVSVVMVTFNFGAPGKAEYVLQLIYTPSQAIESRISEILGKYCRGVRLANLKSQAEGNSVEAFYQFSLRRKYKSTELVEEFTSLSDKIRFNIYFDQDEANMAF